MYKHLFKHSLRAIGRQRAYVLINVLGLATGMAVCMIITLFIIHELSFDNFNEKRDSIYRIILEGKINSQELKVTSTCAPIGPAMVAEVPGIEGFLRINNWGETIIKHEDSFFTEDKFIEADSSFFNFFTIPLIRGNKQTVLNAPYTLVLSESTARKIFGDTDPINKMLKVGTDTTRYRVTGIMEDIPENSHFEANMVSSFMTNPRATSKEWMSNSFSTYVMLRPNINPADIDKKIKDLILKYVGPEIVRFLGISIQEFESQGNKYSYYLQPLKEVHLDTSIQQDMKPASDPKYLWIFGSIGFLIIIIASINFMNLSTAQASKRAKEIGIKKVVGSSRGHLISQFIFETMILSLLALLLAIALTESSLPYFNNLLEIKLTVGYFREWYTIPALLGLAIFIGFIAGSYPAFYMSSFNPYVVLKGKLRSNHKSFNLRSILVVLQFAISITLIVGTLIMYRQISYMLNKELGFKKEQVLVIKRAEAIGSHIASFKSALAKIPGVLFVSASTAVPGHNNNNNGYMMAGKPEETYLLQTNWVDHDFLNTYGIQLDTGRFFDKTFSTDKQACVINEQAVKDFLLDKPFSERFISGGDEPDQRIHRPVIGIVKNFHTESLRNKITPYIMLFKDEDTQWGYFSIRLSPTASASTIDEIKKVWASYTSNDPMQYFFMDKDFERMYKEEKQNAQLAILFTFLAIIIAALGLYGLTSFTVSQRTREIGIRKTFGAPVSRIWFLIAKDIIILILISMAIAMPLIYLVADNWLQNYHYRINLQITDFAAGFLIAIAIALATISYRAIKAALLNPAVSLRYE